MPGEAKVITQLRITRLFRRERMSTESSCSRTDSAQYGAGARCSFNSPLPGMFQTMSKMQSHVRRLRARVGDASLLVGRPEGLGVHLSEARALGHSGLLGLCHLFGEVGLEMCAYVVCLWNARA